MAGGKWEGSRGQNRGRFLSAVTSGGSELRGSSACAARGVANCGDREAGGRDHVPRLSRAIGGRAAPRDTPHVTTQSRWPRTQTRDELRETQPHACLRDSPMASTTQGNNFVERRSSLLIVFEPASLPEQWFLVEFCRQQTSLKTIA